MTTKTQPRARHKWAVAALVVAACVGGCGGTEPAATPSTSATTRAAPQTNAPVESPAHTAPPAEPKKSEEPAGPLKSEFNDGKNTYAGVDDTNKTWVGGFDLKPGKYRTVDDFDPAYTPSNTCRAFSGDSQDSFDDDYRALLTISAGDEVTSVGCGTWRRIT